MLYKIKDKYYILVGNKYIEVKFSIKDDNVSLSPDLCEIYHGFKGKARLSNKSSFKNFMLDLTWIYVVI